MGYYKLSRDDREPDAVKFEKDVNRSKNDMDPDEARKEVFKIFGIL